MAVTSSPAEGLPPDIGQRLAALQRQFVAGLPARWQAIEQAPDAAARHSGLHRLAGSAGSFGFDELGRLAHQAEFLLTGADPAALAQALTALQAELQRCVLASTPQSGNTVPGP